MADNIDKTRPERLGERSFMGTGVGTIPDVMEENKDLRRQIQDMINEALANVVGATVIQDVPDQIDYNFFGGGIDINTLLSLIESMIWDIIGPELDNIYLTLRNMQSNIVEQDNRIWEHIRNLESGTGSGSGVNVYKWVSNNGTDGNYNCYLQDWVNGAWANVDTNVVVVDHVVESDGHSFNAEVYFYSLDGPDENDVVPVNVLELSVKKAYVKTTPGATTTLAFSQALVVTEDYRTH